jgi:transglutaminase-like putative cysteine protease
LKVSDLATKLNNDIYLLRLSYPEKIEKQIEVVKILKAIDSSDKSIIEIAQQCNEYVFTNFTYTKGITNIETTLDEILEHRKSLSRFCTCLITTSTAGIPSRYVSGYICPNESGLRGGGQRMLG